IYRNGVYDYSAPRSQLTAAALILGEVKDDNLTVTSIHFIESAALGAANARGQDRRHWDHRQSKNSQRHHQIQHSDEGRRHAQPEHYPEGYQDTLRARIFR